MVKISFWLKKLGVKQDSLEHIIIDNPKKVLEGKLSGMYACEVYLPVPGIEKNRHLIYAGSPIEVLCLASEFVKSQLQFFLNRGGYTINEVENHEPWKLEKKDPQAYLQEKIEAIKNDKSIPQEGKDKILGVLKESFGRSPSPIKDQINKLI